MFHVNLPRLGLLNQSCAHTLLQVNTLQEQMCATIRGAISSQEGEHLQKVPHTHAKMLSMHIFLWPNHRLFPLSVKKDKKKVCEELCYKIRSKVWLSVRPMTLMWLLSAASPLLYWTRCCMYTPLMPLSPTLRLRSREILEHKRSKNWWLMPGKWPKLLASIKRISKREMRGSDGCSTKSIKTS